MKEVTRVPSEVTDYAPKSRNGEWAAHRQNAFEQGLIQYHETAAERDELKAEVARLRTEISAYKVMIEGHTAQQNEMLSRVQTMVMVRDQAVADRAKYEALFVMLNAQMRAFAIPAAPLVAAAKEEPDGMIEADGPVSKEELENVRERFRNLRS